MQEYGAASQAYNEESGEGKGLVALLRYLNTGIRSRSLSLQ